MDNNSLQAQTQENMTRIDDQLNALIDITGSARVTAEQIGQELRDQEKMLNNVHHHMEGAEVEIEKATTAVQSIKEHKGTCAAWILSLLCLIGIVVALLMKWGKGH